MKIRFQLLVFFLNLFSLSFSLAGEVLQERPQAAQESRWSKALLEAKMDIYKNACDDALKIFLELNALPYPSNEERSILIQVFKSDLLYCAKNADSARTVFNAIQKYQGKNRLVNYEYLMLQSKFLFDEFKIKEANQLLQKAFNLAHEMKDAVRKSLCANMIARNLTALDFYEDSYNYRKIALKFADGDSLMRSVAYSGIANYHYVHTHQYDSAIHYYKIARKFSPGNNKVLETTVLLNSAAALLELGKWKEAEQQVREIESSLPYLTPLIIGNYYNTLGFILISTGRNGEAIEIYKKGLAYNEEHKDLDLQVQLLGFISDAYAASGNYKDAYHYHFRLEQAKDSLRKLQTDELLIEKDKEFQTSIKEEENARLTAENDLQLLTLKAKNRQLIGGSVLIALLFVLLAMVLNNYRNKQRHIKALDALNGQLTEQRDEILRINQLLQLKVLRTQMNPHFIYNCLNSILHLVQQGEKEKAADYLLRFAKLLRQVLDFSDRQFIELEEEIQFLNLYLSLEKMRLGDNFNYSVTCDMDTAEEEISIPSLVIQPFVENAVWHGLSTKENDKRIAIRFSMVENHHQMHCIIDDNGIGRAMAAQKKENTSKHVSKGMAITEERLQLLRYKLEDHQTIRIIDKIPEENSSGTIVELTLPVAQL
ncbi:MAG: histidine kinase [Bacteroidetes bacterium]|nr:histidine kinase [Bacteroidota bacterium]